MYFYLFSILAVLSTSLLAQNLSLIEIIESNVSKSKHLSTAIMQIDVHEKHSLFDSGNNVEKCFIREGEGHILGLEARLFKIKWRSFNTKDDIMIARSETFKEASYNGDIFAHKVSDSSNKLYNIWGEVGASNKDLGGLLGRSSHLTSAVLDGDSLSKIFTGVKGAKWEADSAILKDGAERFTFTRNDEMQDISANATRQYEFNFIDAEIKSYSLKDYLVGGKYNQRIKESVTIVEYQDIKYNGQIYKLPRKIKYERFRHGDQLRGLIETQINYQITDLKNLEDFFLLDIEEGVFVKDHRINSSYISGKSIDSLIEDLKKDE